MIAHFIEATQKADHFNHGKFMLARLTGDEITARSALPDYTEHSLWTLGGQRKFRPGYTLVVDLQTGEGASFSLEPHPGGTSEHSAMWELEKHEIWVCPMFPPFLAWLFAQDMGGIKGDIRTLPRYVELDTLDGALYRPRQKPLDVLSAKVIAAIALLETREAAAVNVESAIDVLCEAVGYQRETETTA